MPVFAGRASSADPESPVVVDVPNLELTSLLCDATSATGSESKVPTLSSGIRVETLRGKAAARDPFSPSHPSREPD